MSLATIQSSAKLKTENIHLTTSQININPQTNDTILEIRNDSDNIITLNKNMKIITVNNYEDFSSDFPVSQDILPPLTEKDFNFSGLDSKIKNRLFQLLISHKSVFARSTVELSAAATEHHRISLQHDYPIKCPIYKIPFNLRNEFRRQIADLEEAGIISKSNFQYNISALFVKRYIKNFAKRALPLTNLLRKDTPFEWTSETQEAFDDIKKAILNPPVLALPDPDAELQIMTDASSRGIGAVLEQKYPNSEFSRFLGRCGTAGPTNSQGIVDASGTPESTGEVAGPTNSQDIVDASGTPESTAVFLKVWGAPPSAR
ncbi:zinc finger protein 90 [Trichonephila clavipes]|nr:zinc finger protein 90 [Trichonephila clavipes]